jgi:hypothetical protein
LEEPTQLVFGLDGDIYIGEGKTLAVKRFDPQTGQAKGTVATGEQDYYKTYTLTGMAFAAPRLKIFPTLSGTRLSWPVTGGDFVVEARSSLDASAPWEIVPGEPVVANNELNLEVAPNAGPVFFRLRQQH